MHRFQRMMNGFLTVGIVFLTCIVLVEALRSSARISNVVPFTPQVKAMYEDLYGPQGDSVPTRESLGEAFRYLDSQRMRLEAHLTSLYRIVTHLSIIILLVLSRIISAGMSVPRKVGLDGAS